MYCALRKRTANSAPAGVLSGRGEFPQQDEQLGVRKRHGKGSGGLQAGLRTFSFAAAVMRAALLSVGAQPALTTRPVGRRRLPWYFIQSDIHPHIGLLHQRYRSAET